MALWLAAGAIGLVAGVLSGAFGIGGGIIMIPAIRLLLDVPAIVAVGTPLPVIVPGALTGAISYARTGLADSRAGLTIALAGMPLSVVGAWLATHVVGGNLALLMTAGVIVWAATDMLAQARAEGIAGAQKAVEVQGANEGDAAGAAAVSDAAVSSAPAAIAPEPPAAGRPSIVRLAAIGATAGLLSGLLGVGGGFAIVPLLTRWLRFPIKNAIGTSLAAVTLLAVPGTVTHGLLGNVDWQVALGLAMGIVPGAMLGSKLAIQATDKNVRVGFAVLLLAVAVWLGANEILAVT